MKTINVVILLALISCQTICPATKRRKLRIFKRSRVTMEQDRESAREQLMPREKKAKLCTPDVVNSTTKIITSFIQAGAIVLGAVLRGLIEK